MRNKTFLKSTKKKNILKLQKNFKIRFVKVKSLCIFARSFGESSKTILQRQIRLF